MLSTTLLTIIQALPVIGDQRLDPCWAQRKAVVLPIWESRATLWWVRETKVAPPRNLSTKKSRSQFHWTWKSLKSRNSLRSKKQWLDVTEKLSKWETIRNAVKMKSKEPWESISRTRSRSNRRIWEERVMLKIVAWWASWMMTSMRHRLLIYQIQSSKRGMRPFSEILLLIKKVIRCICTFQTQTS